MKNLLLIVNPHSGKAKMRTALLGVVEIFSKADYNVTVYPTKARSDATRKIETLKTGDYDIIVVCGGDGTLNEVITGLMRAKIDTPIGYIPAGTLNEWSSGLGISRTIRSAANDIVNGKEITLDIGRFGNDYFTYTASFGAFTSASYSANQEVKNVLGQAAYFFEGVKALGNIKPIPLKFEANGKVYEDEYLFGAVSNSMSVGGIVKFSEKIVKLNDGLFEVLLIKNPSNILKLQPLVDGILKHDLDREGMEFFHTDKIIVSGCGGLDWTLDGEHAASDQRVVIQNIKEAVRFIVPNKGEA